MNRILLLVVCSFFVFAANSQYFIEGAVKDENGKGLFNVKIELQSHYGYAYSSENGAFKIPVEDTLDYITFSADGFEVLETIATANHFNQFTLKKVPQGESLFKHKLLSFSKDSLKHQVLFYHGNESYLNIKENDFLETKKFPETSFALHIDKASYSNLRRFINNELKVPVNAVRIEEMLNYFNLPAFDSNYFCPSFCVNSRVTSTPWKKNNLLFVNIRAPLIDMSNIPASNLVFLIDVSGSMDQPNRLPLLQSSFKLLVKNLREKDTVAIVVYGGNTGIYLTPTSGKEKDLLNTAIGKLKAGGETPGESAIVMAYQLAQRMYKPGGNNRIILATDGDFNVGQTTDKQLEDLVAKFRQTGIYLTCLGVGTGNYKDSKLETLARKGNGNFAYLDNINEAEKILFTEFSRTMYAVANDAHASISFDPSYVNKYRLIGFDNRVNESGTDTTEIEGGELGTGHSLFAVFEYEPNVVVINNDSCILGKLKLHYKPPGLSEVCEIEYDIPNNYVPLAKADSCLRFATSVIMFGELLKRSKLVSGITWDEVLSLAKTSADFKNFEQTEFIDLVNKARIIYTPGKKKKD